MAIYVLVHGGGHGGWCYSSLARLLRGEGYDVYTPTLTGLGERSHLLSADVSLYTHITDIVNVLIYEDLHNVILAGHSYGGAIITGVADRALDRISQLVFLDAAMPVNGESVIDASPGLREMAKDGTRIVDGVELGLWPDPVSKMIYGVGDADWDWMERRLSPHPWQTFEDKLILQNEASVSQIPRTIINCTNTLKFRPSETRYRYTTADRVWEIDAGHDLMITEPQKIADMLLTLSRLNA